MRASNRVGSFAISAKALETNLDTLRKAMGKCFITRCEYIYAQNIFEYIAISEEFREVAEGEMPPRYSLYVINGEPSFVEQV